MKILLDAHLSTSVGRELRRRSADIVTLAEWQEGTYRTASDATIILRAYEEERVLVTYDLETIPPLLQELAETGQHHGGVIFVDEWGEESWIDRTVFLVRA